MLLLLFSWLCPTNKAIFHNLVGISQVSMVAITEFQIQDQSIVLVISHQEIASQLLLYELMLHLVGTFWISFTSSEIRFLIMLYISNNALYFSAFVFSETSLCTNSPLPFIVAQFFYWFCFSCSVNRFIRLIFAHTL